MATLKQQFGNRVREIRKSKKLSQTKLADKVGLSLNMIGCIERGEKFASPETLQKLAKVLEVQVQDLFVFADQSLNDEKATLIRQIQKLVEVLPTVGIQSISRLLTEIKSLVPQRQVGDK